MINHRTVRHPKLLTALAYEATEGIIMIDGAGKIIQLNDPAASMFHYSLSDLRDRSIQLLLSVPDLVNHGNRHEEMLGQFCHAYKKDGMEFPVQLSFSYCQPPGRQYAFIWVIDLSSGG